MCAKVLSPEDMAELEKCPHVVEATERFVFFTAEFKERFYEDYQSGKRPGRILREMGIDPAILGQSRVNSIKLHVLKQAQRECGFTDQKDHKYKDVTREKTPEEKIARLEHELAYTKQELEFVKKIVQVDREAQREWESKQRRQKNSGSFVK
jgi:transposase